MDRRTSLPFILRHNLGDESLRPAVRSRLSGLLVRQLPTVLSQTGLDILTTQNDNANPDSVNVTKVWVGS